MATRRCTQRQFLLRPDDETNNAFIYCLAEAAQRFRIEILLTCAMSNHHHTVIYDRDGTVPAFTEHFHKFLAKTQNAWRGRWENFWASEQVSVVHLVDVADVMHKLVYVATNPVKDRLVDKVHHWPGVNGLAALLGGHSLDATRSRHFFRPGGPMPAAVTLKLALPSAAQRARRGVATAGRAARAGRRDRSCRGRRAYANRRACRWPANDPASSVERESDEPGAPAQPAPESCGAQPVGTYRSSRSQPRVRGCLSRGPCLLDRRHPDPVPRWHLLAAAVRARSIGKLTSTVNDLYSVVPRALCPRRRGVARRERRQPPPMGEQAAPGPSRVNGPELWLALMTSNPGLDHA
jgi:putative transposase